MSAHDALFPYQRAGAAWLTTKKYALLGDDCGLGKTPQAIAAADKAWATRLLVLCPAVVRHNWAAEIQRWSETERQPFVVTSSKGLPLMPPPTTVCSYDLAAKLVPWLRSAPHPWCAVVLDEAHYLKSHAAKRTAAVLGRAGICENARHVWALTGTPAPNNASDLWVLLRCFGATSLDYDAFVAKFCTYYQHPDHKIGRVVTGTRLSAVPELKQILGKVMMRRKKEEVLTELPPITYGNVEVEAGDVDLEIHYPQYFLAGRNEREKLIAELDAQRRMFDGFVGAGPGTAPDAQQAMLSLLHDKTASFRRYTGLRKVAPVAEMLAAELEAGAYDKVVIFATHKAVVEGLREKLARFDAVTLFGGTDPDRRETNIKRFQNNPRCRVFIGNVQAAGVGITLTAASQVVVVEPDWVPANNAQAVMRCHRVGQTRAVSVRFVTLANDAIDRKIVRTLQRKTTELTQVMDAPASSTKESLFS